MGRRFALVDLDDGRGEGLAAGAEEREQLRVVVRGEQDGRVALLVAVAHHGDRYSGLERLWFLNLSCPQFNKMFLFLCLRFFCSFANGRFFVTTLVSDRSYFATFTLVSACSRSSSVTSSYCSRWMRSFYTLTSTSNRDVKSSKRTWEGKGHSTTVSCYLLTWQRRQNFPK